MEFGLSQRDRLYVRISMKEIWAVRRKTIIVEIRSVFEFSRPKYTLGK